MNKNKYMVIEANASTEKKGKNVTNHDLVENYLYIKYCLIIFDTCINIILPKDTDSVDLYFCNFSIIYSVFDVE